MGLPTDNASSKPLGVPSLYDGKTTQFDHLIIPLTSDLKSENLLFLYFLNSRISFFEKLKMDYFYQNFQLFEIHN